MSKKRLLISIPSAVNGKYSNELAFWLAAVQVQSAILDLGDGLADASSDIGTRLEVKRLAEQFAVSHVLEQATHQWLDVAKSRDLNKILVPPGWSIVVTPVFGGPISANRNEQVRRFLFTPDFEDESKLKQTDFDAILMVDDDNVPGRHDLHVLCEDIEREDVDVVGGVYCMEAPEGPRPIVYRLTPDGDGFEFDAETLTKPLGLHLLEKGGLPGGCLMVKRRVFERMWEARRIWFKDRLHDASFDYHEMKALFDAHKGDPQGFHDATKAMADKKGRDWTIEAIGSWHIGEDIWFCRMCHDMGIPVHCDTRVFLKHLKIADNKQTFLRQQAIGKRFWKMGHAEGKDGVSDEDGDKAYRKATRRKAREARAVV